MSFAVNRLPENPLITPEDVVPLHPDWEVVCAFNAGAIQIDGETLLLLRVAERPRPTTPRAADTLLHLTGVEPTSEPFQPDAPASAYVSVPLLDVTSGTPQVVVRYLRTDTPGLDLSDPRMIHHGTETFLTSISHLRLARSRDGVHFEVEKDAALRATDPLEEFGVEDSRITALDGRYLVNYTAVSRHGIATALATTSDFRVFERHGVIFCPENRDVTIFPAKIGGRYCALHRPVPNVIGAPSVWLAWSDNLTDWGAHRYLFGGRPGMWDSHRIGGGAVPIKTEHGWLEIYHGVDASGQYALGAILLDHREPWRILGRSPEPILKPEADYEKTGFYGNVVFTCGCVARGDALRVYYGAADAVTAAADVSIGDVLGSLQ